MVTGKLLLSTPSLATYVTIIGAQSLGSAEKLTLEGTGSGSPSSTGRIKLLPPLLSQLMPSLKTMTMFVAAAGIV